MTTNLAASMMHETDTAVTYVTGIYGGDYERAQHVPLTWACGADLAQWGAFKRQEQVTHDIAYTLWLHENGTLAGHAYLDPELRMHPDRSAALAQRFDY